MLLVVDSNILALNHSIHLAIIVVRNLDLLHRAVVNLGALSKRNTLLRVALVAPEEVGGLDDVEHHEDNEEGQVGAEAARVPWRFGGGVQGRPHDVADRLADDHESGRRLLLRLAGRVACLPGVDQWRDARVHGDQVVGAEQRALVAWSAGQDEQHHAADDWWDAQSHEDWRLELELGRGVGAAEGRDDLDCAKGDVEQDRLEGVVAEGFDDQWAEGGDTAGWNGDGQKHEAPHPGLEIEHGLFALLPVPAVSFNTLLIGTETLDGDEPVVALEKLGGDWRVGHEEVDQGRVGDGDDTEEHEDDLVGLEVWVVDVAESVSHQATEHVGDTVHGVPRCETNRLFTTTPPHLGYSNKGRRNTRLEGSEQKTGAEETSEVVGGRHAA